jgi:NADP-dependent 3-hydroxy acid dehydrogenase YdfG
MDRRISTILIIGATSGIGEGYARRFHGMGKKVIITGRRADRLSALKQELSGIETYQVNKF